MSVIHEAIKRAREARQGKHPKPPAGPAPRPDLTVKTVSFVPSWIGWLVLVFVLGEGALFLRERAMRQASEDKMRSAYLELNDVRGEYLDAAKKKGEHEARLAQLRKDLEETLRVKTEIAEAKRAVEYENLAKEKKVSELTKEIHRVEMSRFQLQEEITTLKAELARASSQPPPANDPQAA